MATAAMPGTDSATGIPRLPVSAGKRDTARAANQLLGLMKGGTADHHHGWFYLCVRSGQLWI